MFPKPKRHVDKNLMKSYFAKQCLLCSNPATPAHIQTQGAGGPDKDFNLMPLCAIHHTMQGSQGIRTFVLRHKRVRDYVLALGWTFIDTPNGEKLFHPKLRK